MQKLVCELCRSNDFTRDDDGLFVCDYCRTKYTPEQAKSMIVEGTVRVDRTGEDAALLTLATNALSSGNYQEAFDYANRALEIRSDSHSAWYLKGAAAGWLSTVDYPRFREMNHAFTLALQHVPAEELAVLQHSCAQQSHQVATALTNASVAHAREFAAVPGVLTAHVQLSEDALQQLEMAYQWWASSDPLVDYVAIASHLVKGIAYRLTNGADSVVKVFHIDAKYRQFLQQRIDWAGSQIKLFHPSYVTPKPTPVKNSDCFVVTATMGREDALPVVTLRAFRDTVLVSSRLGRQFTTWYEAHGPQIARRIESSRLRRAVAFVVIVAPSTVVALIANRLASRRA